MRFYKHYYRTTCEIIFSKYHPSEVNALKFQILRNKTLINDTLIKNNFKDSYFMNVKIPYKEFYKTDTILVTTKNNLKFYISGYHHVPYLHYGMFGYVGSHDCRISENFNVNGNKTDGIIVKSE